MANGYVTKDSMRRSLTNQPPRDQAIVDRFERVREPAIEFSDTIFDLCPESPERSIALRKLEEAVMYAIKSIAIHQESIPG